MPSLPVAVSISIQGLQRYAVGEDVKARFENIIKPQHISEACWITTNEDECFRAAVGALMLSYGQGTPEFERIEAEMQVINQLSAMFNAAEVGLSVTPPEMEEGFEPIGLLGLWQNRQR